MTDAPRRRGRPRLAEEDKRRTPDAVRSKASRDRKNARLEELERWVFQNAPELTRLRAENEALKAELAALKEAANA